MQSLSSPRRTHRGSRLGCYEAFGLIKRVIRELEDGYHVDHRSRLIRICRVDRVEVGDVTTFGVIYEEVVDGILVSRSHTFQPERIGFW
jgi:hypothetical protein